LHLFLVPSGMIRKIYTPLTILIAFSTITFFACTGSDKGTNATDSTYQGQTIIDQPDTVLFWTIDDYNKTKSQVYKDSLDITDPQTVVNGINFIYPDIHLKYLKMSNDTIYAVIDSAYAFTNDMGSSGASEYLSTVVINLTTLKNVNFVNLNFPEGNHASPGVFAKSDFENYKEKEE